ncbi:hypothetical protein F2Q69_00024676 [Brassica cretica]|uniref:Uncharacterized protein n=1 Tax=Brassica cretica TaxID=69181 RepID=A0A8S9QHB8_BRACR|nr:hypothetical protein F2Q69_00024676 [Brassica cretica]
MGGLVGVLAGLVVASGRRIPALPRRSCCCWCVSSDGPPARARYSSPDGTKSTHNYPLKVSLIVHREVWYDREIRKRCLRWSLCNSGMTHSGRSARDSRKIVEELGIEHEPEPIDLVIKRTPRMSRWVFCHHEAKGRGAVWRC